MPLQLCTWESWLSQIDQRLQAEKAAGFWSWSQICKLSSKPICPLWLHLWPVRGTDISSQQPCPVLKYVQGCYGCSRCLSLREAWAQRKITSGSMWIIVNPVWSIDMHSQILTREMSSTQSVQGLVRLLQQGSSLCWNLADRSFNMFQMCQNDSKMCQKVQWDWLIDRFRGISWYSAFYRFFPQGTLARVGKRKPPRFRENSKGSVNSLLTQCCSKFFLVHVSKLILSSCPWQLLFLPCLSDLLRASSVLRYSATSACPTCSATCKGVS